MNNSLKPLKKNYSITLDPKVVETIKDYASNTERSFSQYVNYVLQMHINKKEKTSTNKQI